MPRRPGRSAHIGLSPTGSLAAVCLFLFAVSSATALEARSLRFKHLSRADGLSQSFVYTMMQDDSGYMWFGTQEGLNRYDGFGFTIFAPDADDPGAISDESIRVIIKDRAGTLWIGTDAGGLSRYDADKQAFTNYLHDPDDPTSISDNRIRALHEDRSGQLWVGTDGSGLDRLDPVSGEFEHFPHDPDDAGSLAGSHVWSIMEDRRGALWVATDSGLSVRDKSANSFRHYRHVEGDATSISDSRTRVVLEDSSGTVWAGTEDGGLNRFDRATGTFERFVHDPADWTSISANRIQAIVEDHAGILWVGTVDGLNAFDPDSGTFSRYSNNPGDPFSLPQNSILSLFQDRGGVFWVGTHDGLSRWNPATRAMLHYRHMADEPIGLSADIVTSFAEEPTGEIWIGTYGGGLNQLNRSTGAFTHLRNIPGDGGSLSSDLVMTTFVDGGGVLWVGTRAAGLNRYDPETRSFRIYRHDPDDPSSISSDGISFILEDLRHTLWIATFGGGLNRLDRDTQQFVRYRHDPLDANSLSNDRILVLFEDSAGFIWIGTYGGGLNRFDPETSTFERFTADPARPEGLSGNEISMIQEDTAGDLWIGVKDGGLHRWKYLDRSSGDFRLQKFGERHGLPSSTIYSGIWDSDDRLWLSTARGLTELNTDTLEFRNFDTSHGLQDDEFNLAAGFRTVDGQILFGGVNGFNAFYPNQLAGNSAPPIAVITAVNSLNQAIDLASARHENGMLQLDHREYVIGFEFAATDFAAPEKNIFAYKLEGLDPDWVLSGTQHYASYTNLPPGAYTFRVRAANSSGVWSDDDALVHLYMNPAPWQTWWAYLLYLLAVAALIYAIVRGLAVRTEQRAAVRYAHEMEHVRARLLDAQRIAKMGNWEWHAANNTLWFSDEIYRLLQIEAGTLGSTYNAFLQHVHPDDRFRLNRAVKRVLNKQASQLVDFRLTLPEGGIRHVHGRAEVVHTADGTLAGLAGTVQDISERKLAENAIRGRAAFQSLLASLTAELIHAQPGEMDDQLTESLKSIGLHYRVDIVALQWLDTESDKSLPLCNWTAIDVAGSGSILARHTSDWLREQITSGQHFIVEDVNQMPEAAAADRTFFLRNGVRSALLMPMVVDGNVKGVIKLFTTRDLCQWSSETISELILISNTLATAVARTIAVAEILRLRELLEEENLYLKSEIGLANPFNGIVGKNTRLKACLQAVEKVAPTDIAVLVLGETGTGKELIAREIHKLSKRSNIPMINVNCPALPSTLIESELFGHEKGAFTGAHGRRRGRFELADGGTLFLDEIGELPVELQSKLLRVLQTGEFERLGGSQTLRTDVRLIAATNRDLKKMIDSGEFRADLYYRISSFPICIPPLRKRKDDIPLLAEHFVHKHTTRHGKSINAISAKMLKELLEYSWPGNVRELESMIERALISAGDSDVLDLPGPLRIITNMHQSKTDFFGKGVADLSSVERAHIVSVLESTNWRISGDDGAANALGIPSSTLRSKMKRLEIVRQ